MAVQALTLMIVYVLTTLSVQFLGFLISRLVDYEWPTLGLMTFLILFMAHSASPGRSPCASPNS